MPLTTVTIVRSFGFSLRTAEDGFVALKILHRKGPSTLFVGNLPLPFVEPEISATDPTFGTMFRVVNVPSIPITAGCSQLTRARPRQLFRSLFSTEGDLDNDLVFSSQMRS
jgi:hypothetical protein